MRPLALAPMVPGQVERYFVQIGHRVFDSGTEGPIKPQIQLLHQILGLGLGAQPGNQKPLQRIPLQQIGL